MDEESQAKKVVAPGGEDDDDLGVLVYRESQLRKAEAAASAKNKETSTASTHHRHRTSTSTTKRSPVNHDGEKSLPHHNAKILRKGEKILRWRRIDPGKSWLKRNAESSICMNQVYRGGVCKRHGAKVKLCSSEGCSNQVIKGGVCINHGAKKKLCSSDGCTNQVIQGGVCVRHGANHNTHDESTA